MNPTGLRLNKTLEMLVLSDSLCIFFCARCVIPFCRMVDQPKAGLGVGSGIEFAIRFGGVDRAD